MSGSGTRDVWNCEKAFERVNALLDDEAWGIPRERKRLRERERQAMRRRERNNAAAKMGTKSSKPRQALTNSKSGVKQGFEHTHSSTKAGREKIALQKSVRSRGRKEEHLTPHLKGLRRLEAASVAKNQSRPPHVIKLLSDAQRGMLKMFDCEEDGDLLLRMRVDLFSLGVFLETFRKVDDDGSRSVDLNEFLQHFGFTFRTPLVKRVFQAFDINASGDIDFQEFVVSTWHYATCTKDELSGYFFEMYDVSNKGCLPKEHLLQMVADSYGHHNMDKTSLKAIDKEAVERLPAKLSRREFFTFARLHPALFFPMRTLQKQVQERIGPRGFWENQRLIRSKCFALFTPTLFELRRLFQPEDYLESVFLTIHGADNIPLREPFMVAPSVCCRVTMKGMPNKSAQSHVAWENRTPKFELKVKYTRPHLNDHFVIDLLDWPHSMSIVRPPGMYRPVGHVEVHLRELYTRATTKVGCKSIELRLPISVASNSATADRPRGGWTTNAETDCHVTLTVDMVHKGSHKMRGKNAGRRSNIEYLDDQGNDETPVRSF